MDFIFCKLKKTPQNMNFIFCKLKKPKKPWIWFLQASKTSKNMIFISKTLSQRVQRSLVASSHTLNCKLVYSPLRWPLLLLIRMRYTVRIDQRSTCQNTLLPLCRETEPVNGSLHSPLEPIFSKSLIAFDGSELSTSVDEVVGMFGSVSCTSGTVTQ